MRCYVFIQTTKLHIFSIYGNFLLFIFYFLKDMRTEEHVLSLNQRTCSSVLLSYPRKQSPCSSVLLSYPRNPSCSSVLLSLKTMFSCLITMHIFLIPIKILNCFSLPFQISFILLYINILSPQDREQYIHVLP